MSEIDGGFDPSSVNKGEEMLGDSISHNILSGEGQQVTKEVGLTVPEDPGAEEVKQQSLQEQMMVPQSEPGPLPMVDPQTGTYADEAGNWASQKGIKNADLQFVKHRSDQVRTKKGIIQQGKITTLYNLADVERVLAERDLLPQVNPETNIYVQDGEWAGRTYFGDAAIQYLKKHKDEVRSIDGRTAGGHLSTLYNLEDAKKVLAGFESLPRVERESGVYRNDGGEWASYSYFGKNESRYLASHGDEIRSIEGRGMTGQDATLYNIDDAKKLLERFRSLPRVGEEGIYKNDAGEWGTKSYFGRSDSQYLRANKEIIRTIEGIGGNGLDATLYNVEDARRVLAERDAKPQVGEDGIYRDDTGDWGSGAAFSAKDSSYISSQESKMRTRIGRAANGRSSILYNLEDARRVLAERDAKPQVGEDGIYRDDTGDWGSGEYFKSIDSRYLASRSNQVRIKAGRNLSGGPAKLFHIEDAKKALAERDLLPQVNSGTGIYANEEGEWGGFTALGGADYQRLQKLKDQIRSLPGRNSAGAQATLYHLGDARKALSELKSSKQESNQERPNPDQADELIRGLEEEV